jgi:signal transduction histidine kinase
MTATKQSTVVGTGAPALEPMPITIQRTITRSSQPSCDAALSSQTANRHPSPFTGVGIELVRTGRYRARLGTNALRLAPPLPDVLLSLEQDFVDVLSLLDGPAAVSRMITEVPQVAGIDMAFFGTPSLADQITLHHPVNASKAVEGLDAPIGATLAGKVLAARRLLWVCDYRAAAGITDKFQMAAEAEGMRAVIAAPMIRDGAVVGVLYGANRCATDFGDRTAAALEGVAARMMMAQTVAERARHAAEVAVHEERRRLALRLHDNVAAVLFSLRSGIQRLSDEPQLDAVARTRLSAIEQQAMEASAALRATLRVLHAPPANVELGVAVREHCRAFSDRTGIIAPMIVLNDLPPLVSEQGVVLADAAREALLNVEKYAQAHSVVVTVAAIRGGVALTVSDDGVGLGAGYTRGSGLGLASMSERLARVGGTCTVEPNEDDEAGVTVRAWVPL